MTSCHDVVIMSWAKPIKGTAQHLLGFIWFDPIDCSLWVLVHARIDVLMCPCFQSLLPSNIIDWVVVIAVSIHTTSMPLHTLEASREHCHTFFLYHFHRTSIPSVRSCVCYLHHRRSTS